jgi:hypothetical protein
VFEKHVLSEVAAEVARRIVNIPKGRQFVEHRRARFMVDAVKQIVRKGSDKARAALLREAAELADIETRFLARLGRDVLGAQFRTPAPSLVEAAITRTPMMGRSFGEWFTDFVPRQTETRVVARVQAGMVAGESTDQILRGLQGTKAAGYTNGELARSRTALKAMTQTTMTHTSSHARDLTFRKNADVVPKVRWVSTLDLRTTPMCFDGSTRVRSVGDVSRVFRRHYHGDILLIATASGKQVRCTPNHPILTARGWLPAKEIRPKAEVLYSIEGDGLCVRCQDEVGVPPTLAQLADAAFEPSRGHVLRVAASRADFHGDGARGDGQVDVADLDAHLVHGVETSLGQHLGNLLLGRPDVGLGVGLHGAANQGHGLGAHERIDMAAQLGLAVLEDLVDRRLAVPHGFGDGDRLHAFSEQLEHLVAHLSGEGEGLAANRLSTDADSLKGGRDGGRRHAEVACQRCGRFTVAVSADDVVEVRGQFHSGHVFNLQTTSGFYSANGIVAHNCIALDSRTWKVDEPHPLPPAHIGCRSTLVPAIGPPIGMRAALGRRVEGKTNAEQWLRGRSVADQNRALGKAKAEAWRAGKLDVDEMVDSLFGRVISNRDLRTAGILD